MNDLEVQRQQLRDTISGLTCVQAGWAFGVPEDGRDQWLDLVTSAVEEVVGIDRINTVKPPGENEEIPLTFTKAEALRARLFDDPF